MTFDTLGSIKTATGIGSGLDIQSLVQQLVDVEGKYKEQKLDKDEQETLAKITGFGNLKSALSTFETSLEKLKDPLTFKVKKTSIVNDATVDVDTVYFTATANSNAANSSYTVEVRQLATAHKLSTEEFNTASYVLGTGKIAITVGEGQANSTTYDYTITEDDQTLEGVRDVINARQATSGVSATIITSDTGSRLAISANNAGVKNTLGIVVTEDGDGNDSDNDGLSRLNTANLTEFTAAQDSIIRIDGQAQDISSSTNTLVDVIEGVTINLQKAETDKVHTLNVGTDASATKAQVVAFVDAYNEFVDIIQELTSFNAIDLSKNGDLFGDPTVRNIHNTINNGLLKTVIQPVYNSLSSIGITTEVRTGKLEVNDTKLQDVIAKDVDKIANLFGEEDTGIAVLLYDTVNSYAKSTGRIKQQTDKLNQDLVTIADEKLKLARKLELREIELTLEFSRLDALMGKLQAKSEQIASSLGDGGVAPLSFKK